MFYHMILWTAWVQGQHASYTTWLSYSSDYGSYQWSEDSDGILKLEIKKKYNFIANRQTRGHKYICVLFPPWKLI